MARLWNFPYFIAMLYFTELFSNVILQTEEETEIYLCIIRQICECDGGAENYKRCYSYLRKETSRWFFGELNKCNIGTFTNFDDVVRIGCEMSVEDFHECLVKLEEKVKKRMKETSRNPMKYDEYTGMELSRSCCLPNLSMCVDNPDDCL